MPCTAPGRAARTCTTGASELKGTACPVPASDNYLARSSADLSPSLAPGHPALAEPAVRAVRLTLAWPGARAAQPLPLLRPGPPLWMLVDVVPSLRKWSSPELGPELYYLAQLSMALSDSRTRLRARSAARVPRDGAMPIHPPEPADEPSPFDTARLEAGVVTGQADGASGAGGRPALRCSPVRLRGADS